ncbi:900_t:CDS:2, partial [Gigaspora rosea]
NVVRVGPKFILFDDFEAIKFILKDSDMPKTPTIAGIQAHCNLPTLFTAVYVFQNKNFLECTTHIIGETAFGGSFNMVEKGSHPLPIKIIEELKRRVLNHTFPYFRMFFKKDPWLDEENSKATKQRIDILQILLNNYNPLKQSSPATPVDVTDGKTMSDFEIQDQIMEFLMGGTDTNETLRLFPITLGGIMRQTTEDTIISNHLIPKDTIVSASVWKLHRSKQIWDQDADEFVPERWFDLNPKIRNDAYYPFGSGSRLCIGNNFALMEIRIIISALIGNFDFVPKEGADLQIVQFITPSLRSKKFEVEVTRLRESKNYDINNE